MRRFSGFSFFPLISFYFIHSFKFPEFSRGVKIVRHNNGRSFSASYPRTNLVGQNRHKHFTYLHIQRCYISRHFCHGDPLDPLGEPLGNSRETRAAIALTYCWTLFFTVRALKKGICALGVFVRENGDAYLGVMTTFETDRTSMAPTGFPWW